MTEQKLRVLIVDDEPLARQRIRDLVAHDDDVVVAGEAEDGKQAVEAIARLKPDVVFLDMQMPVMTGLDVIRKVGVENMPATIFVTAFDQFAIKAFEVAALDYLVKPFDDERFASALNRARRSVRLHAVSRTTQQLVAMLQNAPLNRDSSSATRTREEYLEKIPVESRGQVRVIATDKVDWITAAGPYAELHVGDKTFLIRERMQNLEDKLDPAHFFRIHRSAIVRLDRIDVLLHNAGGDYAVRLKNGVELSVSRAKRQELEEKLGI